MKLKNTKKKFGRLILLILISASLFQIFNLSTIEKSTEAINQGKIHNSALVTNTRQWIKNGNFSSQQYWNSTKGTLGDPEDVDANISGGHANYEVLGDNGTFALIADPPQNSDWWETYNPDYPAYPDDKGIDDAEGCWVQHQFTESPLSSDQMASVHWERKITAPVNMSDYIITSASLTATFNATVDENIECPGDQADYYTTYDWARFYVLISNENNVTYEVASYQMNDLGVGNTPGNTHYKGNTTMITIPEESLIIFLTSVLSYDYLNFNITLGIKVWCEDNRQIETDDWDYLLINKINLTFTYEKEIDQQTSVSWNQEGDKPSDIITNPFEINKAILNFKYTINDTWSISSPNSEIKILINNYPYSETVKLSTANTSLQDAKLGGFDVALLINKRKNINITIQVYLADTFRLNRIINISIDDVYLNVTYTETVPDISTNLQLFLNGEDKTSDPVIILPLAEDLNITVKFTNQSGDHIPGALVQLEGKVNDTLTEYPALQQHSSIINTIDLGIGVKILTVIAQKSLYETQNIQFFVEVTEREADLQLFLNSVPKNDGDTISIEADEVINVTVYFRDNITNDHLPNATVTLLEWAQLNETNNQYYNITINAYELDKGINAFTIFAQLVNYKAKSINFFVEVFEESTQYQLFLNEYDKTLDPLFNLTIFENLNITIKFTDNQSQHIINASLQLIGEGLSLSLTENATLQHYSININTTQLGIGVKIFNIIAQKSLYETQNIQFFVEVIEREAYLQLFLNGDPKNEGDTITFEIDDTINITVYFRDNITKDHLPNASIALLGWNNLNETNEQYNITINANDLEQGITALTIFAQLVHYQSYSIQFFIKVVERATNIQLFLNNEDKTLERVFNLTIGQSLNITVKYIDNQTGNHITTAALQLIGEGLSISLTRDDILGQHYIILDTTDLGIGVKLFSIVAQANNYQSKTIDPRITVNRISTLINLESGESQIEAEVGDNILLQIVLNDTVFGGLILNATVTYRWAYGIGELVDPDYNGIYEAILEKVPIGVYPITITAFAGDYYDFETKAITLVVTRPETEAAPDLSWLVYVLIGAIVGLSMVFTLYQTHFKYPPMVRKIRKLKKKVRKTKKTKPILVQKRDEIINSSYQNQMKILDVDLVQTEEVNKIEKISIKEEEDI